MMWRQSVTNSIAMGAFVLTTVANAAGNAANQGQCADAIVKFTAFAAGTTLRPADQKAIKGWYSQQQQQDSALAAKECQDIRRILAWEQAADNTKRALMRVAITSLSYFDPSCATDTPCQTIFAYNPVLASSTSLQGVVTGRASEAWVDTVNFIRKQMGLTPVPKNEVNTFKQSLKNDFSKVDANTQRFYILGEVAHYRVLDAWKRLPAAKRQAWVDTFHKEHNKGMQTDAITLKFIEGELVNNASFPTDKWLQWTEWSSVLSQLPHTGL